MWRIWYIKLITRLNTTVQDSGLYSFIQNNRVIYFILRIHQSMPAIRVNVCFLLFWRYLTRGLIWHLSQPSIYFSLIVNSSSICSWNQPVLSNKGKVSCTRKQRGLWWGSNPRPPQYESDVQSTAPRRPYVVVQCKGTYGWQPTDFRWKNISASWVWSSVSNNKPRHTIPWKYTKQIWQIKRR